MRVLIAPDKFKGSLTAAEVADHLATGIRKAAPGTEIDTCPIADGGEGTVDAAVSAGFTPVIATVSGPTGGPVTAFYARKGTTAVIELASASGLHQLPGGQSAPRTASSRGTGELIAAALDAGAQTIMIGLGGSACTDGGAGMIEALGVRLLDAAGRPVGPGGDGLPSIARLDFEGLHPALSEADIEVACDVDNLLLGRRGAAAVYGPQKGADPADVSRLDDALAHWNTLVSRATGTHHATTPGAGAAGGVGFAALAVLGANVRPGIELLLDLVGFEQRLATADLAITGEGSLDTQTLHGKGPAGVAAAALRENVPALAVAGRVELTDEQLARANFRGAYALLDLEPAPDRCMTHAAELLEIVAAQLAGKWIHSTID
ncbi:glycerate kinase [Pseudonocardia dioxanivorans]|uniref:glycerate kinase n=1 Tax=Pseudonocardia dioxanivorans TaxID=240495 RepID=UPI000CD0D1F0|nr:glycerate kinase [Pseudonocardia dioxanivorans]